MNTEQHFPQEWFPKVYGELKQLAHYNLRSEARNHTFNTTALVHEAYVRMEKSLGGDELPKAAFFSLAAQAMRRILVDYARKQKRLKWGGGQIHITHHDDRKVVPSTPEEILALHDLLEQFKALNQRQYQVVEFWFFGGFKHEEIAEILDVSLSSVRRDWRLARAWLSRELKRELQWVN